MTDEYVQVQSISRSFGKVVALASLSLSVQRNELLALVGPSGAGKSTLLRILAGVDRQDSGEIRFPGDPGAGPVSERHPAVLVFQDYLLFPHMTVFENVAFGLRARQRHLGLSRREITRRVTDCLRQLQIADKSGAWPAHLSGGQQQRVALARALVLEPSLLLLDEPFANLDRPLKRETARFLRELQQRLQVTTVVVSHDIEAVLEIADRVGVMSSGQLLQIDSPLTVRQRPASPEVAELIGVEQREAVW